MALVSSIPEIIESGLNAKLILISAPAGFGKTTAICDWIDEYKIPCAWYSIDQNDNDPVEFLSYVISSIHSLNKQIGSRALKLLKSPNQYNPESVINLLLNDIVETDIDTLLILDDFHLITNKEILTLLNYLLDHLPKKFHLIISTRSDPFLPFARIRSQHQLIEIRSEDLSFTAGDIFTLFKKKMGIKLSIDDANILEEKTEGWIAGLQLAALSLQNEQDISGLIHGLKGNNRYIVDYLMEEVLRKQENKMVEFLLKTAVLESFSAALCDRVLEINNSQLFIDQLEKENMFLVPLDKNREWFRYHHLFADLLKQQLVQDKGIHIEELHQRSAAFYEEHNMHEIALKHLLLINVYDKSIRLLDTIAEELWKNGFHKSLLNYGNQIPDENIKDSKEFSFFYSWILITAGENKKAKVLLKFAERKLKHSLGELEPSSEEKQYKKETLGKIYVAFAYLFSLEDHPEITFDYCDKAIELLSRQNPFWLSWLWYVRGIGNSAIGNLHDSVEDFHKALIYGRSTDNLYLISSILIRLADSEQQIGLYTSAYNKCIDFLKNMDSKGYSDVTRAEWIYAGLFTNLAGTQFIWANLEKALEYIKTAYKLIISEKDIFLKTIILLSYSGILHYLGRYKDSKEKFEEFEDQVKKNQLSPYFEYASLAYKLYLLNDLKELEKANALIAEKGLKIENEINYTNEVAYLGYSKVLMSQGRLRDAETILTKLSNLPNVKNRVERILEIKIQYSLLNKNLGHMDKAVEFLMEAMEIAKKEFLLQYFVSVSDQIDDILHMSYKIQATSQSKIPKEFIVKLKHAINRKEQRSKITQNGTLSIRELDTLKLMAEHYKNREIAAELFISLNTVKTHVRNILLKLDVESRIQAIEKAKKIGII